MQIIIMCFFASIIIYILVPVIKMCKYNYYTFIAPLGLITIFLMIIYHTSAFGQHVYDGRFNTQGVNIQGN